MPVCPICKSEDFELFNGHYFCNECSTQSQEIREEEGDEDILQGSKYLRTVQGKKRDKSEGKRQDKSALWFSCEAYNIILNRQVEALIKMGASPALKNIVMELWFKYLKTCEVAFVSDKDDWIPRLSSYPTCRDISVLGGKNPSTSESVHKRKRGKYKVLDGKRIYIDDNKKKKSKQKKRKKKKKSNDAESVKKKKKQSLDLEQPNNIAVENPDNDSAVLKGKKNEKKSSDPEQPNGTGNEKPSNEPALLKKRKKKKKSSDGEQPNHIDLGEPSNEATTLKGTKKRKKASDQEIPNNESEIPKLDEESNGQSNIPKKKPLLHDPKNYSKFARKRIRVVGTKVLWAKGFAEKCIDRMNLAKTICFCYAGLLFLQEQILLSDIIRWIQELHIPFLNAYRVLPENMILRHTDISALKSSRIPQRRNIVRESSRLLCFLEKREIPPQPVCHFALRYIMDLNIPDEMSNVIHQLVNVQCPALSSKLNAPAVITDKKHMPYYELQAAALVIVVLKIVFGLNGTQERELSTLARERNSDTQAGSDQQTFVWDDWQDHMRLKLNRQKILNVTSTNYSVKESLDVKSLHAFWKEIKITPADVKKMEITNERVMEQRRAIQKAFSSLPNMNQKLFGYRPNSFPISTATAEYVSQEYEVAHFLRDFSTYVLPRASKESSHCYWMFPLQGKHVSKTAELLDELPHSFRVLVDAMCYTTNSLASDLLSEVRKIEKLVFKRKKKKKTKTPVPSTPTPNS